MLPKRANKLQHRRSALDAASLCAVRRVATKRVRRQGPAEKAPAEGTSAPGSTAAAGNATESEEPLPVHFTLARPNPLRVPSAIAFCLAGSWQTLVVYQPRVKGEPPTQLSVGRLWRINMGRG
jgi:hypothetical protein